MLRHTSDGDELDPRDLALLQHVVNCVELSAHGRARWEALVAQVEGGSYIKPWFHGIEHLTRDHEGFVRWKGVQIEHYSFSDRTQEAAAAHRLAAHCRRLEAAGRPVNGLELVHAWDELSHADGMLLPRFALFWNLDKANAGLAAVVLQEATTSIGKREFAQAVAGMREKWGLDDRTLHGFKVVTQEDLDSAVAQQITHAMDVRNRIYGSSQGRPRLADLLSELERLIPRPALSSEQQVLDTLLGAYMATAEPTSASHAVVRERGG